MNILHLSDIHYRRAYPLAQSGYPAIFNEMTSPIEMLDRCMEHACQEGTVDLVVITGDLTEGGTAEEFAQLKGHVEERLGDIPCVVTPGNHDDKSAFWAGWLGLEGRRERYNAVFDTEELAVVSLDSADGTSNGSIDEAQVSWLRGVLDSLGGKPAIVITHHHLMDEQGVVPPVPRAEGFDEALTHGNVVGLLNGHTHHSFTSTYHGVPYFTANSLSFAGFDEERGVRFEEMYGYALYGYEGGQIVRQRIETFRPHKVLGAMTF